VRRGANPPAFPQSFPKGLRWVREISIVKGQSAVVAKILFELRPKIRDGSANAACPVVLSTELLPYCGSAKVWIFAVQFGLRPRGEAYSWGPWRSQPCGIIELGQPLLLFELVRRSPPLRVLVFVLGLPAA
jgi:hypothetical protein